MYNLGQLSKEISRKLSELTLPSDSAGKNATAKVPLISSKMTIEDVQKVLFENAKEFETINYIYIVGKNGHLRGVISIRDVFSHDPQTQIKSIMQTKLIKVHPHTDQEKASHIALKSGIKAVPVVDEAGYFLGVISSDRIQSILESEAKEDFYRFAGIIGKHHPDKTQDLSVIKLFKRRVPWILIGLLGGLLTAKIIGGFEDVLTENLILAGFIPLIAYIANAVGVQTQTVYIRDLATQAKFSTYYYTIKQIITSTLIGITCWASIILLAIFIWQTPFLGFVVGLSVFSAIIVATFFAIYIPYVLKMLGSDPAIGSGPFSTIIQDLLSIIIYFAIASALL
jgi:magnesium transporter